MMVKIMSNSKRIKEKVHFHVSKLAGAVHNIYFTFSVNRRDKVNIMIYRKFINFIDNFKILI